MIFFFLFAYVVCTCIYNLTKVFKNLIFYIYIHIYLYICIYSIYVYIVLEFELRASCFLGRSCTTSAISPAQLLYFYIIFSIYYFIYFLSNSVKEVLMSSSLYVLGSFTQLFSRQGSWLCSLMAHCCFGAGPWHLFISLLHLQTKLRPWKEQEETHSFWTRTQYFLGQSWVTENRGGDLTSDFVLLCHIGQGEKMHQCATVNIVLVCFFFLKAS
jgi:hypothetical protein